MAKKGPPRNGIAVGPWRVGRQLGKGGQGVVFEVRPAGERHGVPRAMKICVPEDHQARERFEREVEILTRLAGQSAPALYEWSQGWVEVESIEGDVAWYVAELFGASLQDLPNVHRAPMLALSVFRDAVAALLRLHDAEVIHRDVKPGNILIGGEPERVVFTDFGIAYGNTEAERRPLTHTRETVGTPNFRAPEVVNGERGDRRSDIYSLGRTLQWSLAGSASLEGPLELPPLAGFSDRAHRALQDVIQTACAYNPSERFQSLGEVQNALPDLVVDTAARGGGGGAPKSDYVHVMSSAADSYVWATETLEADKPVVWRSYTRVLRNQVSAKLSEFRKQVEASGGVPRDEAGRAEYMDLLLSNLAPLIVPSVVAAEHGREGAESVVTELLHPRRWSGGGSEALARLPESAAYLAHNLLGSFAVASKGATAVTALVDLQIPNPHNRDNTLPLWRAHKVVGWPLMLGGYANEAWAYLRSLAERHPWLSAACGGAESWLEMLIGYWWSLCFREFLYKSTKSNLAALDASNWGDIDVPPVFLLEGRDVCRAGFRAALGDSRTVALLSNAYAVPIERIQQYWPNWTKVLAHLAVKCAPNRRDVFWDELYRPTLS